MQYNPSTELRNESTAILSLLKSPNCVYPILISRSVLSFIQPLSVKIQESKLNIVEIFKLMEKTLGELKSARNNQAFFNRIYMEFLTIQKKINSNLEPLQISYSASFMKLVRESCFYLFIDSVIGDLESRLAKNQRVFSELYLLRKKENLTQEWAIEMINEYHSALKIEKNQSTVEQLMSEICLLPNTLELETVDLESLKHLQILSGLLGILLCANGSKAASERHFSL